MMKPQILRWIKTPTGEQFGVYTSKIGFKAIIWRVKHPNHKNYHYGLIKSKIAYSKHFIIDAIEKFYFCYENEIKITSYYPMRYNRNE